jgi:hypothetical protein
MRNKLDSWIKRRKKDENEVGISFVDYEFWGNQGPPQEIIVATGSIRKALMALHLIYGLHFTRFDGGNRGNRPATSIDSPNELQNYFDENIFNGDGQLKKGQKVKLAYFHGVPIFVENGDGEGPGNEPIEQAEKKVVALAAKYIAQDKDVMIISTDTVERISTSVEPMGKPMNNPDYPKAEDFQSPDELEAARSDFLAKYKQNYYPPGTNIENTNGVAVLRTGRREEVDDQSLVPTLFSGEEILSAKVTPEDVFEIIADCGGGGVLQQLIEWSDELLGQFGGDAQNILMIVDHAFADLNARTSAEKLAELEKSIHYMAQFLFYCQVTGMPWWRLVNLIKESISYDGKFIPDEVELRPGEVVSVLRPERSTLLQPTQQPQTA